ncbi:hypothetical protein KS4_27560 [Poriferisphaera corsica]|uniref:Uncharacterized protein n=1 Tax=Poriferisphaera corsica TaxID=2528020 RepID=A0A517YWU4_9BACT|nr:hypothetical protein KS4_27560 [Poriferisphaera corsica]
MIYSLVGGGHNGVASDGLGEVWRFVACDTKEENQSG